MNIAFELTKNPELPWGLVALSVLACLGIVGGAVLVIERRYLYGLIALVVALVTGLLYIYFY